MGEVYRAEDTTLSLQVAVKVLPEAFAADPERMARFEREAELLASLSHQNIASSFGSEEADGKRFVVMELAEGATLEKRIGRGPLPVEEALEPCRQIAEELEAAHEKGIIHRDLKPSNVMVSLLKQRLLPGGPGACGCQRLRQSCFSRVSSSTVC